ncbi:YwaF family protein [Bacillus sp. OTU530]|uniref:YwaF family protein n=1 Tax=Bacillus sp. OTU530 TaxID=3043862 RepID=UPI00313C75FB
MFFSAHHNHHFKAYSFEHIFMIGVLLAGLAVIFVYRLFFRRHEDAFIRTALLLLIGFEAGYHSWLIWDHSWKLSTSLPLELCDINMYICILLLYTKRFLLFEILYFNGIGGELQAILTPALSFSFPHFRFFHFFFVHSIVIWSIAFFVFVKQYPVYVRSIWKAYVFLHIAAGVAFIVNKLTGGNYMFLVHKPRSQSLLDILGPYPWYLLSLEGVTIVIFFLLWLPFRRRERIM